MEAVQHFLDLIRDYVWGSPLLILLVGTGIYLTFRLGLLQLRLLPYSLKLVFSREQDTKSEGDISHFQALMTAMAATIGVGNIIGVATAIVLGGPGALFWMWVAGFFGMATKYGEAILAVKYRVRDSKGEMSGGPMYYLEYGLKQRWLGVLFALFGTLAAFGIGNGTQAKAVADAMNNTFNIPHSTTGIVLILFVGLVVLGGIKSIGKVASFVVPFMALFYLLSCIYILIMNFHLVPEALSIVFTYAFTGEAALGGSVGAAIRFGIARGLFSNEAGLGSAPIAAAAAKSDIPGRQALVSMTQVLFDTLIMCTMTGLTIIMSGTWQDASISASSLTSASWATFLGGLGTILVNIGIVFFASSTLIGWGYYGEKCFQYLLDSPTAIFIYRIIFVLFIYIGATVSLDVIWTFSDILNGLMAFPNLIGLIGLSSVIVIETRRLQRKIKEEKEAGINI